VTRQTHSGFAGVFRLAIEAAIAIAACIAISSLGRPAFATALVFPVFKGHGHQSRLVLSGVRRFRHRRPPANAVNLTDGLDGLAIGPVMVASASFVGIAYLVGNAVFADYLQIHFVPGSGELAVVCGAGDRRGFRLSLVQRAAGLDLHGRHRLAGVGA